MRAFATTLLVLLAIGTSAIAQPNKVKAYVAHSGKDSAGKQLAFFIKEEIRRSATFTEAATYSEGGLQLQIITLDPDDRGDRTIYSATITIYNSEGLDFFVTSFVGYCGLQKLRACAASLYGDMGEQLEDIRKALIENSRN